MVAKSFVFVDLETHDLYRPKITEICLIALSRNHILEANKNKKFTLPRALNKLSLCLSPGVTIHPRAADMTGLSNELLDDSFPVFNEQVASVIQNFFELLPQPVCMVAHNGFKFDFPVLKNAFHTVNQSLPVHIRCGDTLPGFRKVFKDWNSPADDVINETSTTSVCKISKIVINETVKNSINESNQAVKTAVNGANKAVETPVNGASQNTKQGDWLDDGHDDLFANINCDELMAEADANDCFSQVVGTSDVFDLQKSCSQLSWDSSCTMTPKRVRTDSENGDTSPKTMLVDAEINTNIINGNQKSAGDPVTPVQIRKDLLPPISPPVTFKLIDVYERLRHTRPSCHRAEADVIMMLECVLFMGPEILQYFDDNFILFKDVRIPY